VRSELLTKLPGFGDQAYWNSNHISDISSRHHTAVVPRAAIADAARGCWIYPASCPRTIASSTFRKTIAPALRRPSSTIFFVGMCSLSSKGEWVCLRLTPLQHRTQLIRFLLSPLNPLLQVNACRESPASSFRNFHIHFPGFLSLLHAARILTVAHSHCPSYKQPVRSDEHPALQNLPLSLNCSSIVA
jgi:hypothetical protein